MAFQFADDFKGYGTDKNFMLDGLYGTVSGITLVEDPDPNVTGVVLSATINALNGISIRRVFSGARTRAGMGFRMWLSELPSGSIRPTYGFRNGANDAQVCITVDNIGRLNVRTGGGTGTILATTTGPVVTANSWQHIEFWATASATVGAYELRVNGVTVLTGATGNTGTEYFQWYIENPIGVGVAYSYYTKDLFVADSLGGNNNDFIGTVQVIGRTPASDVSLTWTPSTGSTGFNLLDNSPPLESTQYISAADPPPAPSTFGLSLLPSDVTSVKALITQVRARKIDGGDGNLQIGLTSGSDTDLGADRPITTAFTYYEDIFATDPATDAAWTPVSADAAIIQIDRTV